MAWPWRRAARAVESDQRAGAPVADTRQELEHCCSVKQEASVTVFEPGLVLSARFAALNDDEIVLELLSDALEGTHEGEIAAALRPMSVCAVSYCRSGKRGIFLARVCAYARAESIARRSRVVVAVPDTITPMEARGAFRVAVPPDSKFEVGIDVGDGMPFEGLPVDIGFGGIGVNVWRDDDPGLLVGRSVRLTLTLGELMVELRGEVRRRDAEGPQVGYGFLFPDCIRGGRIEPSAELKGLVEALEAHESNVLKLPV